MSSDPQQPDDRELDAFLRGEHAASQAWRQRAEASAEPPAALDAAVLDFARRSQQPKVARWRRWQRPLALAAVLVLSLSVLMRMPLEVPVPPAAAPSKAKREKAEVAKVEGESVVVAETAQTDAPPPPEESIAPSELPARPNLPRPPPPKPRLAPPDVRPNPSAPASAAKSAAASAAQGDAIVADDIAAFPDSNLGQALQRVPDAAMAAAAPAPSAEVAIASAASPLHIAAAPAPAAPPALLATPSATQPEAALVIGSRNALDRRKAPAAVPLAPSPEFTAALAAAAPPSNSMTTAAETMATVEAQSQSRQQTEARSQALFTAAQSKRSKRQTAADLVAAVRKAQSVWTAPEFMGLKLGVATRDQVRERFGAPEARAVSEPWPDADAGSNWQIDVYPRIPGVEGQVEFHFESVSARLMSVHQQLTQPRVSSELLAELKWPAPPLIRSGIGDPCAASGLTGEGPPYWWLYPAQGAYLALPVAGRVEQIVYEAECAAPASPLIK